MSRPVRRLAFGVQVAPNVQISAVEADWQSGPVVRTMDIGGQGEPFLRRTGFEDLVLLE
ncbi:hypothetical protein [Streptomyces sp. NPDC052179]|uniref:hypothetical protein n=1 Tax=Streptomyces sp. NPDC052179 TaxID=3155680 RepID=UPI00343B83DC